jgi:Uncharacterized conserved protein (DUF2363).
MTEALSILLTKCENDTPPFENVITTALSSLHHQSRFQFALELQQTFESKKDVLSPKQQLCILCAIYDIGNGFGTFRSEWDVSHHAFGEFLLKYQHDVVNILTRISYTGQFPLLQVLNNDANKERDHLSSSSSSSPPPPTLLFDPCIVTTDTLEQQQPSLDIQFHRPLPPFICNEMLQQRQIHDPELNLQFFHTTYPSLRFQWMPSMMSSQIVDDSNNDDDAFQSSSSSAIMEGLMQKVFQEPLELEEEAAVLKYCQVRGMGISSNCSSKSPQFVTLDNLSLLVEHNPNIAFEILLTIQDEEEAAKFHSKLVNMEVTLNTMEVVYKLATATSSVDDGGIRSDGSRSDAKPKATRDDSVMDTSPSRVPCKLHAEYLHVFILGLFERCALSQDRKMVRLVSVFLQNLIQNGIVQVDDLVSAQVQAFCIENSRVREAQVLFKLLKDKSDAGKKGIIFDGRMMAGEMGRKELMVAATSSSKGKNGNKEKARKK